MEYPTDEQLYLANAGGVRMVELAQQYDVHPGLICKAIIAHRRYLAGSGKFVGSTLTEASKIPVLKSDERKVVREYYRERGMGRISDDSTYFMSLPRVTMVDGPYVESGK